jgi:hypothetical protein
MNSEIKNRTYCHWIHPENLKSPERELLDANAQLPPNVYFIAQSPSLFLIVFLGIPTAILFSIASIVFFRRTFDDFLKNGNLNNNVYGSFILGMGFLLIVYWVLHYLWRQLYSEKLVRQGRWRRGLFLTDKILLYRPEDKECIVIPKEAVKGIRLETLYAQGNKVFKPFLQFQANEGMREISMEKILEKTSIEIQSIITEWMKM